MAVVLTGGDARGRSPRRIWSRFKRIDTLIKFIVCLTVMAAIIGGIFLYLGIRDYRAMRDAKAEWVEVSDMAVNGETEPVNLIEIPVGSNGAGLSAVSDQAVYKPDDMLYKAVDLKALQMLNANVSGYIYIPGTVISYPIMREVTPGDYFYIDHDIYNKRDKYGSIFELCGQERGADSAVDWIFGHHMASGSMFSGLYDFLDAGFAAATPVYIYRDGYRSEFQALGCCVVDKTDPVYMFGKYESGSEAYAELLEHLRDENKLDAGTDWFTAGDGLTVLSTCYGGAGTRQRVVVLLKELRRAVTPEYYRQLADVYQYGGSTAPLDPDALPGGTSGVDPDGALTDLEAALTGGPGTNLGSDGLQAGTEE